MSYDPCDIQVDSQVELLNADYIVSSIRPGNMLNRGGPHLMIGSPNDLVHKVNEDEVGFNYALMTNHLFGLLSLREVDDLVKACSDTEITFISLQEITMDDVNDIDEYSNIYKFCLSKDKSYMVREPTEYKEILEKHCYKPCSIEGVVQ